MIDGESMDAEKAARYEFRDLLDTSADAGLHGNDKQIAIMSEKLRLVAALVRNRSDVRFSFNRFVDGLEYPRFASSDDVEVVYSVEGPPELVQLVIGMMNDARADCLTGRNL